MAPVLCLLADCPPHQLPWTLSKLQESQGRATSPRPSGQPSGRRGVPPCCPTRCSVTVSLIPFIPTCFPERPVKSSHPSHPSSLPFPLEAPTTQDWAKLHRLRAPCSERLSSLGHQPPSLGGPQATHVLSVCYKPGGSPYSFRFNNSLE